MITSTVLGVVVGGGGEAIRGHVRNLISIVAHEVNILHCFEISWSLLKCRI